MDAYPVALDRVPIAVEKDPEDLAIAPIAVEFLPPALDSDPTADE